MPFALGRFSTITLVRHASPSLGASSRAMKSGPVPPTLAATMRMVLGTPGGAAVSWAGEIAGHSASPASSGNTQRVTEFRMIPSFRAKIYYVTLRLASIGPGSVIFTHHPSHITHH